MEIEKTAVVTWYSVEVSPEVSAIVEFCQYINPDAEEIIIHSNPKLSSDTEEKVREEVLKYHYQGGEK